jgi:hypothetical protein
MRLKPVLAALGVAAATLLVPAAPAQAWSCDIPVAHVGSMPQAAVYTGTGDGAGVCVYVGPYISQLHEAGWYIGIDNVRAIPSIDTYTDACPTSDDLAAGAVADPSNPLAYTPYRIAAGVYGTEAQICLITRDVRMRLVFTAETGVPSLTLQEGYQAPGSYPLVEPGPASRACYDRGNIPVALIAGPVQALSGWALADDGAYVCVRAGRVGGRLRIDADGNAGPITTVATRLNCPTSWWSSTSPVAASVRTGALTADGRLPVCVSVAGFEFNYFVHTGYRPGTPVVDWAFD